MPQATEKVTGAKGKIRRQQIIDAAKQTLIEGGSSSLVLRDVADQIGITHGNLQYYFPTKDDLLIAIFDQAVEKYTDSMKVAVSETSTRKGRLDAIIDAGIKELNTPETSLWRMMMSLADHNPDMASILKKENDLYEQVVAEELKIISPSLSAFSAGVILPGSSMPSSTDSVSSFPMKIPRVRRCGHWPVKSR